MGFSADTIIMFMRNFIQLKSIMLLKECMFDDEYTYVIRKCYWSRNSI